MPRDNIVYRYSNDLILFFSSLWISEERELVHEIAGLGELREPWHSSQMSWLENHLSLINTYSTALENLDNHLGINNNQSNSLRV